MRLRAQQQASLSNGGAKRLKQESPLHLLVHVHVRLYTTTTAASVDDADSQPIKYRWTRPTLDIAVPALIGMMAGEQGE